WSVDSNGNYLSNIVGVAAGNSTAVESQEPNFQQDLNGDGIIGVPGHTNPAPPAAVMTSADQSEAFNFRADLGAGQQAPQAPAVADALPVHPLADVPANVFWALADAAQLEHPVAMGGQDPNHAAANAAHLDHFLFG